MLTLLLNTLEQTIMFIPLSIAIYISYRLLKLSDLSLDGSFVLGGAVFARTLIVGTSPFISFSYALIAGLISGAILAALQYRNRVNDLISSIVLSLILYSINLNIMGRPSLDLGDFRDNNSYLTITYLIFCSLIIIYVFYSSKIGLALRAFGDNYTMLNRLGINAEKYRLFGLMLSGGLVSGSGAIAVGTYGYCNVDMGVGVALTALSTVIIGKRMMAFIKLNNIVATILFSASLGSYIYFLILNSLLMWGISPVNFKLVTGIIIIIALLLAKRRH